MLFDVSTKNLRSLQKLATRAPRLLQRAGAEALNRIAFRLRENMQNQIALSMTSRSKGLLRSHILVTKATPAPLSRLQAEAGSYSSPRFSGWEEQETGVPTKRKRVATLDARGGGKRGTVYRRDRLLPSQSLPTPDAIPGMSSPKGDKGEAHRAAVLLSVLNRMKYTRPFLMYGSSKLDTAVYKFTKFGRKKKGGKRRRRKGSRYGTAKITTLYRFDKSSLQPKRKRWASIAYGQLLRHSVIDKEWAKAIDKVIK